MLKDGGLLFIILATLLVTISMISSYIFRTDLYCIYNALIYAIPFAFAWVVIAWVITDKSILRRPLPYVVIFIVIFVEKIYWALFYNIYPITYTIESGAIEDALAIGSTNFASPSREWLSLFDNANNFFIIVEFIVMLVLFGVLWYLARPKDFTQISSKFGFLKTKKMGLLIIGSILMTVPLWIWKAVTEIGWAEFFNDLILNSEWIDWHNLLFYGIPIALAMLIAAFIITNIQSRAKYVLYIVIFLSVIIPRIPTYDYMFWVRESDILTVSIHFKFFGAMFFIMFLSFLLLSKTKYIEQ